MSETETPLPIPVRRARRFAFWRNPWLMVVLLALALAFWQWYETRSRLIETQQELARRLGESDAAVKMTRADVLKAQEQVLELTASLNGLEARMAEFQGQTAALQGLYQELAKSRDDASLMEIEQGLSLAAQQLQLAGNVQTAVLALQTADAKLAVLNRPQFLPLRKAIGRDLNRLRALPFVDIPGISLRLEVLAGAIDEFPLAVDARPQPEEKKGAPSGATQEKASVQEDWRSWWRRIASEVWQELRGLVRIQRFDRAEPVLLAPGQSFFLRENLKLRLLNARLALLSRDQWVFRKDLKVASGWLEQHFDRGDRRVQGALETLEQFSGTDINIELPNLNESHAALRVLKSKKEKK